MRLNDYVISWHRNVRMKCTVVHTAMMCADMDENSDVNGREYLKGL